MIKIKENISVWCDNFEEISMDKIYNQYIIVKDFFNSEENLEIRIILCSNKEELKFFTGLKEITESTTGRALISENIIVMYTPKAIEENTPKKKENFRGILAHEMAHLFYNKKKYSQKLQILNEGIASYVQWIIVNKKEFDEQVDIEKVDLFQEYSREIYKKGLYLINFIIKNIGKEKLIDFLNKIEDLSEDEIKKEFKESFATKLKGGTKNDE
jgi:hypothetical protein